MKSIIEYFYCLDLQANESNPPTISSQKEDELYEKLQAILTNRIYIFLMKITMTFLQYEKDILENLK